METREERKARRLAKYRLSDRYANWGTSKLEIDATLSEILLEYGYGQTCSTRKCSQKGENEYGIQFV